MGLLSVDSGYDVEGGRSLNGVLDVHGQLVLFFVFLVLQVHLIVGRIVPRLTSAVAKHQINRTAYYVHDRRRYEHYSPGCLGGLKRLTDIKGKISLTVKYISQSCYSNTIDYRNILMKLKYITLFGLVCYDWQ